MPHRAWTRLLLTAAKVAVVAACFVYLGLTIARNLADLRQADLRLRLVPLIASFPLAIAYLLGRGLVWHLMVRRLIGALPLRVDLTCWLSSLVGKYLPGKMFLLFGRVYLYRGSATVGQVGLAFALEACCSALATVLIFGLAVAAYRSATLGNLRLIAGVIAAALLTATHPAVLRLGVNTGLRLARRPPVQLALRWADILLWTALMSANWLVLGGGFYLLLLAVLPLPADLYLFVTGALAVAGVIGVVVLIAPSGIGVREGVLTFVLANVLPSGVAAVAALLARAWITAAEGLCSAAALSAARAARLRPPAHENAKCAAADAGADRAMGSGSRWTDSMPVSRLPEPGTHSRNNQTRA